MASCRTAYQIACGGLVLAASVGLAYAAQTQNDTTLHHVPRSNVALTAAQIAGSDGAPDWRPNEHPPMPAIVAKGRPPAVFACGICHLPNGAGLPGTAALAGESVGYIKQQITNFRNGDRVPLAPPDLQTVYRNGNQVTVMYVTPPQIQMVGFAKAMTDPEVEEAAAYYSKLPAISFVKVVESATAPKTILSRTGFSQIKAPDGGTQPTTAIIEVADDAQRADDRDPDVTYTADVPPGSLAKGKELATNETSDKTIACKECHGDDLKGDGDTVPWIAGRSPSYIFRQLVGIKTGKRTGTADPMKMVVEKLTPEEMVAIAAYVASLKP